MDNLRISSKIKAKEILKSNFLVCFAMALLYSVPAGIFSTIMSFVFELAQYTNNIAFLIFILTLSLVISLIVSYLLLMPLVFGTVKAFYNTSREEKGNISDVFYYFQSSDRLKWCYKLIWKYFIKTVVISLQYLGIPYIIFLISVFAILHSQENYTSTIISVIAMFLFFLSAIAILILAILASIKLFALELSAYICVITDSQDIKSTINENMFIYKDKKSDLFIYSLSFIGWAILATFASCFTLGASFVVFSMYQTMVTILYAKYNYDLYGSKKPEINE